MALNSESVIKIVDLLCEGPIQGLAVEGESVFLDETPLKTGGPITLQRMMFSTNLTLAAGRKESCRKWAAEVRQSPTSTQK